MGIAMQDNQQFEQLILMYNQLKNGALDIKRMLENEDFDSVMSMLKHREGIFLNCKCMRKYLELTPEQEKEASIIFNEIKSLEEENIKILAEGLTEVKAELQRSNHTEKIQQAYDFNEVQMGIIVNLQDS